MCVPCKRCKPTKRQQIDKIPRARLRQEAHSRATDVRSTALAIHDSLQQIMRHGQHVILRQASAACWGIVLEMEAILDALPQSEGGSKPNIN